MSIRRFISVVTLSSLCMMPSFSAQAAPDKPAPVAPAPPAPALIEVNVCPMTGEKVGDKPGGTVEFAGYKVNFCCAGCPTAFAKLSDAEKTTKIEAALKIQNAPKTDKPAA